MDRRAMPAVQHPTNEQFYKWQSERRRIHLSTLFTPSRREVT